MINKGNKKLKTIHKGSELVSRVYKGDELIFQDLEAIYGWKFTIDTTKNTSGGTSPNNKSFTLERNSSADPSMPAAVKQLKIRWGDGVEEIATPPVAHQYTNPGTYQITIIPTAFTNGLPDQGWLRGVAMTSTLSSTNYSNTCQIISIDKPYPARGIAYQNSYPPTKCLLRGYCNLVSVPDTLIDGFSDFTLGTDTFYSTFDHCGTYTSFNPFPLTDVAFRNSFGAALKGDMEIPTGLFPDWDTSNVRTFSKMFTGTFATATNSTASTIPSDLFSFLNTANGTNFSEMFYNTFSSYGYYATSFSIPATLFSSIDTSSGLYLNGMFAGTFTNVARECPDATIPDGLFSSIDTTTATVLGGISTNSGGMFERTFTYYGSASTTLSIPATLFSGVKTDNASDVRRLFSSTFQYCGQKSNTTIPAGLFDTIVCSSALNLSYLFQNTFSSFATESTSISIPAGLFANLDTSNATNVSYLFYYTFLFCGQKNASFTIPAGVFSTLDTTNVTNFSGMFAGTFSSTYTLQAGTIPATLFSALDTTNGKNFANMFYGTFQNVFISTIPATLFSSVDTSSGETFTGMFKECFYNRDQAHTMIADGNIPETLFATIDTSNGTTFFEMFARTFDHEDAESPPTSGTTRTLANLFSAIDTSNCTGSMAYMFDNTFTHFFHHNPVDIASTLFSGIDMSGATDVSYCFYGTFEGCDVRALGQGLFGGTNVPQVSRNGVFRETFYIDDGVHGQIQFTDVFDGMTNFSWADASNASTVLLAMFRLANFYGAYDSSTGNASDILQHFNFIPNARTQMFENRVGLSDYATIDAKWK